MNKKKAKVLIVGTSLSTQVMLPLASLPSPSPMPRKIISSPATTTWYFFPHPDPRSLNLLQNHPTER